MTATAGEVVLERLQKQVLSEGCPIRSACVRVDNLIEGAAKDESCRVLLGILPALLNVMFGDPHQVDTLEGWVGKTRDRETANTLFTLLEPKGRLFSLLLQHSDFEDGRRPVYQLPIGPNDCPLPRPFLNKLLSYGSADTFPTPFNKLITRTNLVDPPFTLGLDPTELFIHRLISFAYKPKLKFSMFPNPLSASTDSLADARPPGAYRFSHVAAAELYHRLIDAYLHFFMPVQIDGFEPSNDIKIFAKDPGGSNLTLFSKRFLRSSTGSWSGMWLGTFFYSACVHYWLYQSTYDINDVGVVPIIVSDPPFEQPPLDIFEIIKLIVRHTVRAVTSSERPNGIPSQLINHYEGYIDWSFVTLRPALYQFLRLALASCPADSSISPIIDTWIDFVAPWRYIKPVDKKTIQFSTTSNFGRLDAASQARSSLSKSGFSASFDLDQTDGDIVPANSELQDEWSEYVVANVLFYTVLLGEFIDFSLSIVRGVESVVSGEKAGAADAVERALSPIVISLLRIISMACLPVADVLRATEDALSETGLHRSTILTSFREQLSALEVDNFRLRLLFEPLSVERVKAIILGLDRIFRGMRYEEPRLLPPSEAFREGCDPAALISQTRHNLLALFHLKNADIMQDEELSQYIHNEKPADQGSSAFRRIRGGASDRLSFKMKSSPLRIGNQKSLRAPKLIRTYESKWLVYLTSQLEIWLDARLAEFTEAVIKNLADRSIPAPRLLRALACYRFDLRFLAAYSNIVLLLACSVHLVSGNAK